MESTYWYGESASGRVEWQLDNVDPFGANMANENPTGQGAFNFNLRFPGQYFDRETNTHYNVNRDYNPAIGGYIQSDPTGLRGGSFSTFIYVGGNPLSFTDPLGLTVYVGEHGALIPGDPLQHTAIVLQPNNPADFNFPNNTSTLGGQPGGKSTSGSMYGNLHSAPNYPGDSPGTECHPGPLNNLTIVPTPQGMTDTQFINALINAANSYQNNLTYDPIPDPFGLYYNSNSYTSGVITNAGGTPPTLPGLQPGYGNPIPKP